MENAADDNVRKQAQMLPMYVVLCLFEQIQPIK